MRRYWGAIKMKVLFNLPSISLYPDRFQMLKKLACKLGALTVVTTEANQHYMDDLPDNMRVLEIPSSKLRFLESLF